MDEASGTAGSKLRVFVSYHHDDRRTAWKLVSQLEASGLTVWWDPALIGGQDIEELIRQELNQADLVLVLWSELSVKSDWVRDEARTAQQAGKLFPIKIQPVKPPLGFGTLRTPDFLPNEQTPERVQELCEEIETAARNLRTPDFLPNEQTPERVQELCEEIETAARNPARGAPPRRWGVQLRRPSKRLWWLLLLVVVALMVLGFVRWPGPPRAPCAVRCLERTLQQRAVTVDRTKLSAVAALMEEGTLTLSASSQGDVMYRSLSDATLVELMRICTDTCKTAPIRVAEAWTTAHVVQKTPGGALRDARAATVVLEGGERCTTDGDGQCRLQVRDVPMFGQDVTIQAKLDEQSVREARRVVDILTREVVLTLNPPAEIVEVVVMRCESKSERVASASVRLSVSNADAWQEACGRGFPQDHDKCQEARLSNGVARFYVSGQPTKLAFVVTPERTGQPATYEREPGRSSFTLQYPPECTPASGVAPKPSGSANQTPPGDAPPARPKRCVRGKWAPQRGDLLAGTQQEKDALIERCQRPPPPDTQADSWSINAAGVRSHCACDEWN